MMIVPPNELSIYISIDENGQWIHDPNMPKELEPTFYEFVKNVEEAQKKRKEGLL